MADTAVGPGAGRGFDPQRRERVMASVRARLRARGLPIHKAKRIVDTLEEFAVRQLSVEPDVVKQRLVIPPEVCSQARGLQKVLRERSRMNLLALAGGDWHSIFDLRDWMAFERVLATLASRARKPSRPRDERLRSLDFAVVCVLAFEKLFAKTSEDVADIHAECKAAAGFPAAQGRRARDAGLRRALERIEALAAVTGTQTS